VYKPLCPLRWQAVNPRRAGRDELGAACGLDPAESSELGAACGLDPAESSGG